MINLPTMLTRMTKESTFSIRPMLKLVLKTNIITEAEGTVVVFTDNRKINKNIFPNTDD